MRQTHKACHIRSNLSTRTSTTKIEAVMLACGTADIEFPSIGDSERDLLMFVKPAVSFNIICNDPTTVGKLSGPALYLSPSKRLCMFEVIIWPTECATAAMSQRLPRRMRLARPCPA